MKNSIKFPGIIALLITLIGGFGWQEEFLDVNPKGTLSSSNLASEAGVNGVLIGAYSLLNNGGTAGGSWPSGKWIFGGVTSDDAGYRGRRITARTSI